MKSKILIILTFISLCLHAQAEVATDGHIRSSVYELEGQLSQNLENQISQFSGLENLWISVKFDVDVDALKQFIDSRNDTGEKNKTERPRYMDLPGLALGNDGAEVDTDKNQQVIVIDNSKLAVNVASILAYTKGLSITVYRKGQMERKVERLIRSLIEEKLSSLKVDLEVKFNHRMARPLENSDFDEGKKVRFETQSFAKSLQQGMLLTSESFFTNSNLKGWLFAGIILIFSAISLICFFFIKSMGKMSAVLETLAKSIQSQSGQATSATNGSTEESYTRNHEDNDLNASASEMDVRQKIVDIYDNYRETITNFFSISMENKDFHDIWCLSQVLGDKLIFENANILKSKNFKEYNLYLRENLFSENSFNDYKRLYQKLMGLMLYPAVYFHNNIRRKVSQLQPRDLALFFETLNKVEKSVIAEAIDPLKLASLINQGLLHAPDIMDFSHTEIEMNALKKLDQNVTIFLQDRHYSESEKTLEVLTYLSQAHFNAQIEKWGLSQNCNFNQLYKAKKNESDDFFKSLNVEELCAILPMLSPEMQNEVEAMLPEIKLARIIQAGRKINHLSSGLMSRLFMVLINQELKLFLSEQAKSSDKSGLKAVA